MAIPLPNDVERDIRAEVGRGHISSVDDARTAAWLSYRRHCQSQTADREILHRLLAAGVISEIQPPPISRIARRRGRIEREENAPRLASVVDAQRFEVRDGRNFPHPPLRDKLGSMDTVSLQDLQQDPASFLDRVEAGERIIVYRGGRPVAELRPLASPVGGPRPFGLAAGSFTVPADFDAPLPEDIVRDFEGR